MIYVLFMYVVVLVLGCIYVYVMDVIVSVSGLLCSVDECVVVVKVCMHYTLNGFIN